MTTYKKKPIQREIEIILSDSEEESMTIDEDASTDSESKPTINT